MLKAAVFRGCYHKIVYQCVDIVRFGVVIPRGYSRKVRPRNAEMQVKLKETCDATRRVRN